MKFNQIWKGASVADGVYSDAFSVTVPGNIQRDYAEFKGWGDHNYMNNCLRFADIEDLFWSYKTNVEYTANENEKVFFVTNGIEYEYDIILNGKVLTHHEGMFTKVEIDITEEIKNGNELEILIYPHPKREGAPVCRDQADQSCKPTVEYGWDWHPRMLVSGIYDETYIETRSDSHINDVEAKEYIRVLHCIYEKEPTLPKDEPKITRYIGVSQAVCDSWYRVTGKKAELCYNPVNREPFKKIMHLVSATRLSEDKGGGRMQILASLFDSAGVPYIWDIFTNDFSKVDSPNIVYHEPNVIASGYFRTADYVVQLSNDEGFGFVPEEALQQGVPVIVTPFSVLEELGIKDGENAIVLPFDMKNIDVWDIYNRIGTFKFKYEPRTGDWRKLMSPGKGTYQEDMSYVYKVRFTKNYEQSRMIDAVKLRRVKEGEECVVDYNRYVSLLNHPKYGQLAELVEKIKI